MRLSGAGVLAKDWIGTLPAQGPVLYMSCEEDDDEVRRRMEDVARHFGSTRQEMVERGLRFLSFAGRDAVLAQPDRSGIMRPTPLLERLRRDALQLRPKAIILDTVADTFGGKENDRGQTRQFITMLRGLAIEADSAVIMSAHPSLTGIATDTGLSGNTGWHNGPRARMYFKPAPGDDPTLRVLEVKKNNYGPVSENVLLRWRDGVYVVEPGKGTLERLATEAEVNHLFIKLLRRLDEQGRNVSDKVSPSYAPSVFAGEPEAKNAKVDKKAFTDAMARLFAARKIRVVPFGPASRMRSKIVEADPSNNPSNDLPTPSNDLPTGCEPAPPIPPMPVGSGQEGVGSPARSNGRRGEEECAPLATILRAWSDLFSFGSRVSVPFLVDSVMSLKPNEWSGQRGLREIQSALLAVAEGEPGKIDSARLEQWLRENSGVEVGQLRLRDAGTGKDGLPLWTLELRVEPDKGALSL
jgi:AAA domain-containing protein